MVKNQFSRVSVVPRNRTRRSNQILPINHRQPQTKKEQYIRNDNHFSSSTPRVVPNNVRPPINNRFESKSPIDANVPKNNKCVRACIVAVGLLFTLVALAALVINIYLLAYIANTTTTTTARPVVSITQAGDPIIGVFNTTAGGSVGGVNASYSTLSEYPPSAIDNTTSTKYLNFGVNAGGVTAYRPGLNTGFYVTPASSNASVAIALRFATGSDAPDRDPITVTLEGTNANSVATLYLASSWTRIYSGPTGIDPTVDPGRQTYVPQQTFSNTIAFRSYRLLVTSQRGNATCVQYGEAQILGHL